MSEEKATYKAGHWSDNEEVRLRFSQTVADLGLDGQAVPDILGVERVGAFPGTVDDAIDILFSYAEKHRVSVRDSLHPQEATHGEATVVIFTDAIYLDDGTALHVTSRQGAISDDIVAAVLEYKDALDALREFGITTTRPSRRTVKPTAPVATAQPDAVGPTEFWTAAKPYIGPGRTFENKSRCSNWLQQFSTGKGFAWAEAIKALHGFDVTMNDIKADEFSVVGLQPLDNF